MPAKSSIPINAMTAEFGMGVFIRKMTSEDFHLYEGLEQFEDLKGAHRDEYHLCCLQDQGTTTIEIDFKRYVVNPSSVVFIRQNQVHRILAFNNAAVSMWAISNENLNPEYLKLLEDITPAQPLILKAEAFSLISEAVSLCLKLSDKKDEKLYHSLFADSCSTLTGLIIAQYLGQLKSIDKLSRFEIVTKAFKEILELNYITVKSPTAYAQQLNISSPYLNECVKSSTGYSVSQHIQQRVILEAKRLLYYTDKSVKEIASGLGYDDYPYFSRMFTKVAGMSALVFRNKNRI